MKFKAKFDQKAIRDFLLRNVEKIVLGIVGMLFLWMLVSSLSKAGGFGKSPDELQADVRKGDGVIQSTSPEVDLKVTDYAALAKRDLDRVEEAPYQNHVLWDPPLFARRPLRDAPRLLTVQELRGSAGVGAFLAGGGGAIGPRGGRGTIQPRAAAGRYGAGDSKYGAVDSKSGPRESKYGGADSKSGPRGSKYGGADSKYDADKGGRGAPTGPAVARAAAGENLLGKRWVVITGLVPIEQQEAAYAEAFRTFARLRSTERLSSRLSGLLGPAG